jgi:hypothetical protein
MMHQISTTRKWKETEWKKILSPSPPSIGGKNHQATLLELTSVHGLTKQNINRILQDILSSEKKFTRKHTHATAVCSIFWLPDPSGPSPCRICSPDLAPSDFFLCLKAKLIVRSGFSVPGHLQIRFGESVEDHQQRRQCHRRSAMATAI